MKPNSSAWLNVLSTFIKVTHKLKKYNTSKYQVLLTPDCREEAELRAVLSPSSLVFSCSSKKVSARWFSFLLASVDFILRHDLVLFKRRAEFRGHGKFC